MDLENFKKLILQQSPEELARRFIRAETVRVLPAEDDYKAFKLSAAKLFPVAETILVAGSGNWGFSLNPEKLWKPFDYHSDVDVALISEPMFQDTWNEIRMVHRRDWYKLSQNIRQSVMRNGENVYCGFVSPLWIPLMGHPKRYAFRSTVGKLSSVVDEREVTAMIFRNEVEAVDYYQRGFGIARRSLKP